MGRSEKCKKRVLIIDYYMLILKYILYDLLLRDVLILGSRQEAMGLQMSSMFWQRERATNQAISSFLLYIICCPWYCGWVDFGFSKIWVRRYWMELCLTVYENRQRWQATWQGLVRSVFKRTKEFHQSWVSFVRFRQSVRAKWYPARDLTKSSSMLSIHKTLARVE